MRPQEPASVSASSDRPRSTGSPSDHGGASSTYGSSSDAAWSLRRVKRFREFQIVVSGSGNMRLKPLDVLSLLAVMLVSIGAAVVNSSEALAQAPKAETAPAAAVEVKPAPAEVKPPAPPAAAPTSEVVENPYGLEALWRQGDFVARGTLIILMIMSIGSWYIGIIKVIEQARMMKDAKEADEKFWHTHTVQEGIATLKEDSAFRFVAEKSALAAAPRHHAVQAARSQYLGRHGPAARDRRHQQP